MEAIMQKGMDEGRSTDHAEQEESADGLFGLHPQWKGAGQGDDHRDRGDHDRGDDAQPVLRQLVAQRIGATVADGEAEAGTQRLRPAANEGCDTATRPEVVRL